MDFTLTIKKKLVRQILGWTFLILGVIGLVLPVLQGILFITIGIILLSPDIPMFQRILEWLKKRYPKIGKKADKMTEKLTEDNREPKKTT